MRYLWLDCFLVRLVITNGASTAAASALVLQFSLILQEDKTLQWDRMYGDWSSFCYAFQSNQLPNKSVLTTLPMSPDGAKQIVTLVVQPIAANIGITLPAPLSKLNTDKEVNWCMEVSNQLI